MNVVRIALLASVAASVAHAQSGDAALARRLDSVRAVNNVPALGAAFINADGSVTSAVVGVRKRGTDVRATLGDQWHLGSDTKAMTATILATFVERGSLKWETTLGEVFPDLRPAFPPGFAAITVAHLLSHRAGLAPNLNFDEIAASAPSLTAQRINAVKKAASQDLSAPLGTKYEYSNLGYVIAGAVAERIGGKPWETLMREIVFNPLDMKSCGFGGLGTPGKIDQPWPHEADGAPPSRGNGPLVDNVAAMGPARTAHCSLADWAKFVGDQLRGESGKGKLLKPDTYKALHTPRFGGIYAFGWGVAERPWAGGNTLTHAGSNTMNYCVVWIAPAKGVAILAVTNQGGTAAGKALDGASVVLLQMKGLLK